MKTPIEDRPITKVRIDTQSLRNLLNRNQSRFFCAIFIKRTTGTRRVMNCQIPKDIENARFKIDLKKKDLFPVIDTKEQSIKVIPLDTLLEVRMEGRIYQFNRPQDVEV